MSWTERKTSNYELADLPFENNKVEILDPRKLVIRFPSCSAPIDVGVLCYTKRRRLHFTRRHTGYAKWQINLESFREERASIVIKFSEFLFTKYRLGSRPATINNFRTKFIQFIDWCDQHDPTVFVSDQTMAKAMRLYTEYLVEQVRLSNLSVNTAAHVQSAVVEVLAFVCDTGPEDILSGTRTIRRKSASICSIEPPEQNDAASVLAILVGVFTQFSTVVMESKNFPFLFELPDYSLWVFPTNCMVAPSSTLKNRAKWSRGYWAYDFENGRLSTEDEIVERYIGSAKVRKANARYLIRKAERCLTVANQEPRHWARIRLATLACQAFTMLFIANTGMNLSSAISLGWNDDKFGAKKTGNLFKTIRYRANGKEVSFRIGARFIKHFRTYLRLRRWLLPVDYDRLFFRLDRETPSPINNTFSSALVTRLTRVFGPMAKITANQWRVAKSDYLIRHTDIQTAAEMLQNSEETIVRAYARGTRSGADSEMTNFFKSGFERFVAPKDAKTNSLNSGQCRNIGSPVHDGTSSDWQPDCVTAEGCMFCVHYCIHADENDIRKLLSLRYVIVQSQVLAHSRDHYYSVYGAVLGRIDEILKLIRSESSGLAKTLRRVKKEVNDEERLSSYWEKKLSLLVELGVLV